MLIRTVLRRRYQILQILGSGGFGDTYLAEDLDLPGHPNCVVKHFRPKNSNPVVLPIAKRLFESEAEVLYRLGNLHNQIPKMFGHFEENGEFYLVQEFIDGHDLSEEITPGKQLSESEVIKLLQDILEVLAVVHQQNIIHRDIKPQNIMRRRRDGKIVLIDFGAVKEIKGLAANTQGQVNTTIIIGTGGYMPNEQANRKPRLCSDVYAVGIIAIQALTGKTPQEIPEDINSGEMMWRPLANVSDALANVLTNMVSYHFSERYHSAAEALEALVNTVISPPPPPPVKPPENQLSPRLVTISGVVGATCILVAFGIQLLNTPETVVISDKNNVTLPPPQTISPPPLPCGDQPSAIPSPTGKPDKILSDGRKYYGSLEKNKLSGKGILLFKSGAWYNGEFKNDQRNGCGTYSYQKNHKLDYYIGEFVQDQFTGQGKLKWKDNAQYIGQFQGNNCQGEGMFTDSDGQSQRGVWQDNQLKGSNLSCNR